MSTVPSRRSQAQERADRRQPPLTGVDRVLACLPILARESRGASLDEVAARLSSPKSSAHRALAALVRAGLVEQDSGRQYRLSLEFVRLALSYYQALDAVHLVQPIVDELSLLFEEAAHYAILDGGDVVYVAQANPPNHRLQMTARIGGRNPACCTALGKALLADQILSVEDARRYTETYGPLEARTSASLTTAEELAADLEETRLRGYSVDREESDPGIACVAFAVFLGDARYPSGAISVAAFTTRTPLDELERRVDEIRELIRRRLGPSAIREPNVA